MTAFALITAYLLGSVPFGLLLTKICGLGDIRKIGSGNIGATNVLRTGNKKLAALTLFLDCGKGAAAVALAHIIAPDFAALAGVFALLGHIFPVWLKFKGGKGVATSLGVLLALAWPVGLMAICVWLATAFIFKYSSLAAIIATCSAPLIALISGYEGAVLPISAMAALIMFKHLANIKRLLKGTEPKIGKKENHDA